MRVTIEHREETAGLTGATKNHFVDCSVAFSEEEKAIIKARGLGNHGFVMPAATPLPSQAAFVGSGVIRTIGRLLIVGGVILGLYSGFAKTSGEGLSVLMLFGGIGLEIYGWLKGRRQEKRFDAVEQNIRVRDLLSNGRFTVHVHDPAEGKAIEDQIRDELSGLKHIITASAEIKAKQTFEL